MVPTTCGEVQNDGRKSPRLAAKHGSKAAERDKKRLLLVSDFFYPNFGGVENHIYELSQCLIHRGHHVVVMTHAYGERTGVRYLTNGLKVYHVPRVPVHLNVVMPTLFGTLRLLRCILMRERIDVVHGHQAFSVLANECMLHARTLGHPVVFTDHSLFGFADAASICTNKLLKWTLCDVHAVICVSHTSKENTVLRACLPPERVFVIPNAVDTSKFQPLPRPAPSPGIITVVVLNRLVYRKGIDLQALVIAMLCREFRHVRFIIGGDGPKRQALVDMQERHGLQGRVQLVGQVQHEAARQLLVQGDIFLNTSLTEAFCMAIVEAAACGLLVVSTNVGGVPEVLPEHMRHLAEPTPDSLMAALRVAVERISAHPVDRQQQHDEVAEMYSWGRIAQRTEVAYNHAANSHHAADLVPRLERLLGVGPFFGILAVLFAVLDSMWLAVVQVLWPADAIERARDASSKDGW